MDNHLKGETMVSFESILPKVQSNKQPTSTTKGVITSQSSLVVDNALVEHAQIYVVSSVPINIVKR